MDIKISDAGHDRNRKTIKSVGETLRDLQVQTGASDGFTMRVENELLSRGVDLDENAAPYAESLREAFLRDLCKREDPRFVKRNVNDLQASYQMLRAQQEELVEKMEEIANALRKHIRFESDTLAYDVVPGPGMTQ